MKNQPLVSVIISCYNHENFVKQAIISVLDQTYKNIELFVIDDGSKDNSSKIIKELSDKYTFYFKAQNNIGFIPTINKLEKLCNGKYIAIIASDDIWALDKIEKQVSFMENDSEIAVCGGNVIAIDEFGNKLPRYFQFTKNFNIYTFIDFISLKAYLPASTALFRKDIIDKLSFYDETYKIEDLYMWLKISHAGYKIALLKDLLGFYRIHSTNISKNNQHMLKGKLQLLNLYRNEEGYMTGVRKAYLHYYIHCFLRILPNNLFPFRRS